ncbi:MAG TPA: L,D-transpeptidase [Longimicrobiales bacterium]|nr:L,D-transpeptidase [Longimicrobiales bacterium]
MKAALTIRLALVVALAMTSGACAAGRTVGLTPEPVATADLPDPRTPEEIERDSLVAMMERAHAAVPATPYVAQPTTTEGARVWRTAASAKGMRVVVSTESRALWLMRDSTVLFNAPVAVGMEEGFTYRGRKYDFQTPLGRRRVLAKDTTPVWTPPDWHYFEIALNNDLEVVQLVKGRRVRLADSTHLEIRGNDVGRVNQNGHFYAFPPGNEIIFDGKVFVPPFGTRQRQIPDVLGTHKLVMGDGYLIHGTDKETSIGDAVSHGCVRMFNADVERLFELVPVGTPVFIY